MSPGLAGKEKGHRTSLSPVRRKQNQGQKQDQTTVHFSRTLEVFIQPSNFQVIGEKNWPDSTLEWDIYTEIVQMRDVSTLLLKGLIVWQSNTWIGQGQFC